MKVVVRFILTLVCLVFVLYLVDVRAVFSVSGKSSQVMPQLLQALLAVFIPMALMIVWVFVSYWLRVRRVAQLHQTLIERRATGDMQR